MEGAIIEDLRVKLRHSGRRSYAGGYKQSSYDHEKEGIRGRMIPSDIPDVESAKRVITAQQQHNC